MSNTVKISLVIAVVVLIVAGIALFFLRSGEEGGSILPGFLFPQGEDVTFPGGVRPGTGAGTGTGGTGAKEELPRLRKLANGPVAGTTIIETAEDITARWMERETGHVFDIPLEETGEPVRVSNTTIPKVHDAVWQGDGKALVARYLTGTENRVETFAGAVTSSIIPDEPGTLDGAFLPRDAYEIAVSPDETKIFYLLRSGGGATGITADFKNAGGRQIFSHPFTEWNVQWPTANTIALQTKPSGGIPGFLYFINVQAGAFTKILGDVPGLTALVSPDTDRVLYSQSGATGLATFLSDIKTKQAIDLPLVTLPEKCVWGKTAPVQIFCFVPETIPAGRYPDVWYQGLVSFEDNLWSFDVETGAVQTVAITSVETGENLDGVEPHLSEGERFIIFTNKRDGSLWSVRLKE